VSAVRSGRRGPKPGCSPDIVRQMYELHYLSRASYQEIAAILTDQGTKMPRGGLIWTKWSVRQKMRSAYGQEIAAGLGLPLAGVGLTPKSGD
jgi:hypothetical protein